MANQPDVTKPKEPPKPVQIGGESLVDRILPHMKKIIAVALGASVAIFVIFGVRWCGQRGEAKETEKLAAVLRLGQQPVALPGAKPDPQNPAFSDATDRAKALLAELDKQGANPPGRAYRASLSLSAGNVDKALEEYRAGASDPGLDGVLCREGIGIALEAKAAAEKDAAARNKLLEEALAAYQRMQPDEKGPRRAYALYHQGRILDERNLNRKAEAKAAFEKANELLTAEPRHELKNLLQQRLASLGAA